MKPERGSADDSRIQSAMDELNAMIAQRYPGATFDVSEGEDPEGIYLTATVDVEDTTEVMDVVVDRLVDMQVEEGLPVYVVPVQPLARVIQELQASRRPSRSRIDWSDITPSAQP